MVIGLMNVKLPPSSVYEVLRAVETGEIPTGCAPYVTVQSIQRAWGTNSPIRAALAEQGFRYALEKGWIGPKEPGRSRTEYALTDKGVKAKAAMVALRDLM